ncbi:MAG: hypothetical protein GY856_14980, partial [bacterium]|nr:hypothetical protein [bacterium]
MNELRPLFFDQELYVHAANDLIRHLACMELAREVIADPSALARFLFFYHSRGEAAVTGAAFIDRAGGLADHRCLFPGYGNESGAAIREMLRLALNLESSILVFHVRADGDDTPGEAEKEFFANVGAAAELLAVPVLDSWVMAGPRQWSSLTHGTFEPPAATANQEVARRPLTGDEEKAFARELGSLLRDAHEPAAARLVGRERAGVLLERCGGLPGLAATPPDELSCPGLPAPALAGVAAALEVARRIRSLEVPRRRPSSESAIYAALILNRATRLSGGLTGAVFIDRRGAPSIMPALVPAGLRGAIVGRRWLLSQAFLTKARCVQPFTLTPAPGDPAAGAEESEFWDLLAEMRPFVDFEILDHLRIFADGGWRAGER